MDEFRNIQSIKILSGYCNIDLYKGGAGSGRHKSSVQKLEESGYSEEEDAMQKKKADDIVKLKAKIETGTEQTNKLKKLIVENERKKSSFERAGFTHDHEYHLVKGRIAKYNRELKEAKEHIESFKKRLNDINH